MSNLPDALWLNSSPSLQCLDRPLLRQLSKDIKIAQWEYHQTQDEASSLFEAVTLLHRYLEVHDRPIHLAGHGIGGVIALLYARRHPDRVRSLSLLGVAPQPAITWHAYYYIQRQMFSCSRAQLLAQLARNLFECSPLHPARDFFQLLDRDLDASPNLHSLFRFSCLPKGGVSMPLLVCGSATDFIVDPHTLLQWQPFLKPQDDSWECSAGHHFFHYHQPEAVAERLLQFWQSSQVRSLNLSLSA